jgi:hypothetical protein
MCRALLASSLMITLTAFTFAGNTVPASSGADDLISQSTVVKDIALYGSSIEGVHQVCPPVADAGSQPFCRKFNSPMLDACGSEVTIYLVLANGDIHQVNNALIGIDGGFDAAFHSDQPLELHSAWVPKQSCGHKSGLPEVLAIDGLGNVMHFNGERWRQMGVVIAGFVRN